MRRLQGLKITESRYCMGLNGDKAPCSKCIVAGFGTTYTDNRNAGPKMRGRASGGGRHWVSDH